MRVSAIRGVIERRILVNYPVAPAVIGRLLPEPFRPQIVHGHAVAGICLIRLARVRPKWFPLAIGIASENAAHRIAVEWEQNGQLCQGVYIPRRDTSSWLNAFAGGRLFPGEHHHARFQSHESDSRVSIQVASDDGQVQVFVTGSVADQLPRDSIFTSLAEVSRFFERGSIGYSATRHPGRFDGLELNCQNWQVTPLAVEEVRSSFFSDLTKFPEGSIAFDCALLMRGIEHEWLSCEDICCDRKYQPDPLPL